MGRAVPTARSVSALPMPSCWAMLCMGAPCSWPRSSLVREVEVFMVGSFAPGHQPGAAMGKKSSTAWYAQSRRGKARVLQPGASNGIVRPRGRNRARFSCAICLAGATVAALSAALTAMLGERIASMNLSTRVTEALNVVAVTALATIANTPGVTAALNLAASNYISRSPFRGVRRTAALEIRVCSTNVAKTASSETSPKPSNWLKQFLT